MSTKRLTSNMRVKEALLEAHDYAKSRLFNEVGVSLNSTAAFELLCQTYRKEGLCLFTGAGVSFTKAKYYETPGWWDLLMEIYGRISPQLQGRKLAVSFKRMRTRYPRPWDMASVLEKRANKACKDRFTEILCRLLYGRTTVGKQKRRFIGGDKDKRLPRGYLQKAETLNAVIAFCSKLSKIMVHPCYSPNHKVAAVLTLNYDCFLEAGATQKHNKGCFRPISSGSSRRNTEKLPVYHIHGYIPYGGRFPKHDLVLTKDSYRKQYKAGGFAQEQIDHNLSKFSTLFVGISFDDRLLLNHLKELAKKEDALQHFALLKHDCPSRLIRHLSNIKLLPILYSSHEQIPSILGHVYKAGLPRKPKVDVEADNSNKIDEVSISQDQYWELLVFNKA